MRDLGVDGGLDLVVVPAKFRAEDGADHRSGFPRTLPRVKLDTDASRQYIFDYCREFFTDRINDFSSNHRMLRDDTLAE